MGIHDSKVSEKLGREIVGALSTEVDRGSIGSQKMADLASQLNSDNNEKVSGNHLRRMEKGDKCDQAELRNILSDWWQQSLFDMDKSEAIDKLTDIFDSDPVDVRPLAKRLREIKESENAEVQKDIVGDEPHAAGVQVQGTSPTGNQSTPSLLATTTTTFGQATSGPVLLPPLHFESEQQSPASSQLPAARLRTAPPTNIDLVLLNSMSLPTALPSRVEDLQNTTVASSGDLSSTTETSSPQPEDFLPEAGPKPTPNSGPDSNLPDKDTLTVTEAEAAPTHEEVAKQNSPLLKETTIKFRRFTRSGSIKKRTTRIKEFKQSRAVQQIFATGERIS